MKAPSSPSAKNENKDRPACKRRRRLKKIGLGLLLAMISCVIAFALAETFLRVVPIRGITFHSFYYDDLTGQRLYPGSTVLYQSRHGETIRRSVNSWGYLDKEHDIEKKPGTVRIGFFGDSYTQAQQVPFEDTFFRIIERTLNESQADRPVECIAIAMIGYSTLQSYLEYQRWADSLSLDHVVYVFCENDPGDNIPAIKRAGEIPYPRLSGGELAMDFSFRERTQHKNRYYHRMWQYAKSNSLVFSTLESRLKMLVRHGVKLQVTPEEMQMGERAQSNKLPGVRDLPSSWPDSMLAHAKFVGEKIMTEWYYHASESGKRFTIIYIPRWSELLKPPEMRDWWKSWVEEVAFGHGIELVDPTDALIERMHRGEEIYDDHLARAGHRAVAESFLAWYLE